MRDPYTVFGLAKTATEADIKKAFRKLAKEHHPDRNTGDASAKDKFAEVNSAYEILGDATKRAQFDRGEIDAEGKPRFQGFEGFPGSGARDPYEHFGFGSGGAGRAGRAGGGAEDIFSQLFGEGLRGRGARPMRGEDIAATLTITLQDIATDARQRITLPGGREVDVTVPPGVADGQTIRLRGLGRPGTGGADAGDVMLTIKIAPQEVFTIDGSDLRTRIPIELEDAILGGRVRVPTPTGAVDMTIPPMTTSGRTFRLRGKGLPRKGGAGDLFAVAEIRLPETADPALTEYAQARRDAKVD